MTDKERADWNYLIIDYTQKVVERCRAESELDKAKHREAQADVKLREALGFYK